VTEITFWPPSDKRHERIFVNPLSLFFASPSAGLGMTMRIWAILPALALSALGALALSGGGAERPEGNPHMVRLAALQTAGTMSDACVWSPEAAVAGEPGPCAAAELSLGILSAEAPAPLQQMAEAPHADVATHRPLIWPDDFIALTIAAATDAWSATVGLLTDLYDYAFEGEETDKPSGS